MSANDKILEESLSMMADTVLKLKDIMGKDAHKSEFFLKTISSLLQNIITTTVDLAELSSPGLKTQLYADIETMARKGGVQSLNELGVTYCLSDISPNDLPNAMNYLGKTLSVALYKGLYELPRSLQTDEILLRAVEGLLTNLLDQKFNKPNDPHAILDSFCEHVHLSLRDVGKRATEAQNTNKKTSSPVAETTLVVEKLDKRAKSALEEGGEGSFLLSLHESMNDIRKVMDDSTQQELDEYCQKYPWFYRYMYLLEELAAGLSDGSIKRPE